MKYRLTNTHDSPLGVNCEDGSVRVIQPGKSLDVELSDAEAADIISGRGPLKASRQRAAVQNVADVHDPSASKESDAAGVDAAEESEPAEAGDSGVVVPEGNKPRKARQVLALPKGKGKGGKKKGPASGR